MLNSQVRPNVPGRTHYTVGVDLGKLQDHSAISIIQEQEKARRVVYLERLSLGMPFPDQVERLAAIVQKPALRDCDLVVDATGCGLPVVDMIRAALTSARSSVKLVPVWLTSGSKTSFDGHKWNVPKRVVVDSLAVMFENGAKLGNFQIDKRLPLAGALLAELRLFQRKIHRETGAQSYGNRTDKDHDDLVLAVALGAWGSRSRLITVSI